MRKNLLIIIIVICVLIATSSLTIIAEEVLSSRSTSTTTTSDVSATTSLAAALETNNITYCSFGGHSEQMSVFVPWQIERSGNIAPVVLYVYGGGWINGSRYANWKGMYPLLMQDGIIQATINYFEPPPSPSFPINIEEVACAVRYLRANAVLYHIDPNHIGLMGDSAGANLVSLEALAALNGTFDNYGQYTNISSKVQAVIDAFGPANLTDPSFTQNPIVLDYKPAGINLIQDVFGGNQTNLVIGSPVNYAKPGAPPFLILQGENDTVVPPVQSIQLYNALLSHNDSVQLVLVKNSEHEFYIVNPSEPQVPNLGQLQTDMISFFNSTLTP